MKKEQNKRESKTKINWNNRCRKGVDVKKTTNKRKKQNKEAVQQTQNEQETKQITLKDSPCRQLNIRPNQQGPSPAGL